MTFKEDPSDQYFGVVINNTPSKVKVNTTLTYNLAPAVAFSKDYPYFIFNSNDLCPST